MKLCAAQIKPVKGDVDANIIRHKALINAALSRNADVIIFPELSITGYEPTLAADLASDVNDTRLKDLQDISNANNVTLGVGMPLKGPNGISISMILFQPRQPRQVYSKKYLHSDEVPFFAPGQTPGFLLEGNIAPAICYEISIAQHSEDAHNLGARVYFASVAKTAKGVERAMKELPAIANQYSMQVLMSNCVGHCDNFECGGSSSVWNNRGALLGHLDDRREGILIYDTGTEEIEKIVV